MNVSIDVRQMKRLLPTAVLVLGAIAGGLLAVVLLTRPEEPIGQASPSPTTVDSQPARPSQAPSIRPSTEASALPSLVPEPSEPATPPGPARLAWTAGRPQDGGVNAVIRFGDRWIAGGALDAPLDRAAVWTSTDGVSWSEPVILEPELRNDIDCDHHWISGFARWNGELLALGWNGYGCGDGGNPMLWRSADGATWDLVDLAGTTFAAEYPYPESAVETPDGRLAIFGSTHLGSVRVLFLTSDLETWETHRISDGETESYVASLAASPTVLIGVGSVVIGEREVETWTEEIHGPSVVTSPDGVTWTSAAPPVEEGTIAEICWDQTNGRFVAVGTDADGLPFAWLTADGSQWTPIRLGDEQTSMRGVKASQGLIVATGETGIGSRAVPGDTVVWSSRDGANWWYGTVLEGRAGSVASVTSDTAILISNRRPDDRVETWLSMAGTVAAGE